MKFQKVNSSGNAEKWKVLSFDTANSMIETPSASDASVSSDYFDPIESDFF
jgi:hypothetical protein